MVNMLAGASTYLDVPIFDGDFMVSVSSLLAS